MSMDLKPFKQWMDEDAPAMAAGNGAIAGIGVGPKGEPGIRLKKRNVLDGTLEEEDVDEAFDAVVAPPIPEPPANPLQDHHTGVIDGLRRELGRTRYLLSQQPHSRKLKETEASLNRKITRENNKIAKALDETVSPENKDLIAKVAKMFGVPESLLEAVGPTDTFAGADVFDVNSDAFQSSRFGKNRYHRYSKYVGEDEKGEAIRQHGRATKRDIILKDEMTGAMVYLRRKGQKNT